MRLLPLALTHTTPSPRSVVLGFLSGGAMLRRFLVYEDDNAQRGSETSSRRTSPWGNRSKRTLPFCKPKSAKRRWLSCCCLRPSEIVKACRTVHGCRNLSTGSFLAASILLMCRCARRLRLEPVRGRCSTLAAACCLTLAAGCMPLLPLLLSQAMRDRISPPRRPCIGPRRWYARRTPTRAAPALPSLAAPTRYQLLI